MWAVVPPVASFPCFSDARLFYKLIDTEALKTASVGPRSHTRPFQVHDSVLVSLFTAACTRHRNLEHVYHPQEEREGIWPLLASLPAPVPLPPRVLPYGRPSG